MQSRKFTGFRRCHTGSQTKPVSAANSIICAIFCSVFVSVLVPVVGTLEPLLKRDVICDLGTAYIVALVASVQNGAAA
jgi:hypothetical protein